MRSHPSTIHSGGGSGGNKSRIKSVKFSVKNPPPYEVGDRIDIEADGVYCPGIIRDIDPTGEGWVYIHYVGWAESYDEIIPFAHVDIRVSPPFRGVQKVKVWAFISKDCPYWPCIAFVRCPRAYNTSGIEYLMQEEKVFVVPIGEIHSTKKYFDQGFWLHTKLLRSFHLEIRSLPWQFPPSVNTFNTPYHQHDEQVSRYLKRIHPYCTALYEDEDSIFFPALQFQASFEQSLYEIVVLQGKILTNEASLLDAHSSVVPSLSTNKSVPLSMTTLYASSTTHVSGSSSIDKGEVGSSKGKRKSNPTTPSNAVHPLVSADYSVDYFICDDEPGYGERDDESDTAIVPAGRTRGERAKGKTIEKARGGAVVETPVKRRGRPPKYPVNVKEEVYEGVCEGVAMVDDDEEIESIPIGRGKKRGTSSSSAKNTSGRGTSGKGVGRGSKGGATGSATGVQRRRASTMGEPQRISYISPNTLRSNSKGNSNNTKTSGVTAFARLVIDSFYAHEDSLLRDDSEGSKRGTSGMNSSDRPNRPNVTNSTISNPCKSPYAFSFSTGANSGNVSKIPQSTLFYKQVISAKKHGAPLYSHGIPITSYIPFTNDLTMMNAMLFQIADESPQSDNLDALKMPTLGKGKSGGGIQSLLSSLPRISSNSNSSSSPSVVTLEID